jgi:predicted CoA-substrate-specific enzyme activase
MEQATAVNSKHGTYSLGIDIGSHFTKLVVVDSDDGLCFKSVLPTRSRHRENLLDLLAEIRERFNIRATCATGYGRDTLESNRRSPEIVCAAIGVSSLHPVRKTIIDIGGEDIKIIESGAHGEVEHFHMNDKCSAGTGAFITEIAEKAEIELAEMSDLASRSTSDRVMNSFCTVFAKTEILGWKFDGVPIEDMSRGIYLSIVDRICKLPIRPELPVYLCGGVAAHHPYVQHLMTERLQSDVQVTMDPQFMVALGAAILARR